MHFDFTWSIHNACVHAHAPAHAHAITKHACCVCGRGPSSPLDVRDVSHLVRVSVWQPKSGRRPTTTRNITRLWCATVRTKNARRIKQMKKGSLHRRRGRRRRPMRRAAFNVCVCVCVCLRCGRTRVRAWFHYIIPIHFHCTAHTHTANNAHTRAFHIGPFTVERLQPQTTTTERHACDFVQSWFVSHVRHYAYISRIMRDWRETTVCVYVCACIIL